MSTQHQSLVEKIKSLPPERVAEVENFVDLLSQREARSSEKSARHADIAAYAARHGGSEVDFDLVLEAAAVECLLNEQDASQ